MHVRGSSRLTLLLILLVGLVSFKLYRVWEEGLPQLPERVQQSPRARLPKERKQSLQSLRRSTANIVKNNLFDPARGANDDRVAEATPSSSTAPEEFVLLGTLITSRGRKALIQILPTSGRTTARGRRAGANENATQVGEVRRVALGDPLGDYLLAEVEPHKVILKKGSEQLELVLDFVGRLQMLEKAQKPQKPKVTAPQPTKMTSQTRQNNLRNRRRRSRDRGR